MKKYVIIVAGGSGSRMGAAVPKQFLDLAGTPILVHTLHRFYDYSPDLQVILVLPKADLLRWESLSEAHSLIHSFTHSILVTPGGATRFQSVHHGLDQLKGDGLVAIHDAVRPLVSVAVIERTFKAAAQSGSGIAAVAAKDSIRQVNADQTTIALDRASLRLIQTPQTFQIDLLKKAFNQPESPFFTDDASVVEAMGIEVTLVEGSYDNLKITTPEDLIVAEALLRR